MRECRLFRILLSTTAAVALLLVGMIGAPNAALAASSEPVAEVAPSAVDPGGRIVEFSAGGANPVALLPGPDGSVWVANFADKKIVRLDGSGIILNSVALQGSPSSLASDNAGGVWTTEFAERAIDHVWLDGIEVKTKRWSTPGIFPTSIYATGDYVFITESEESDLMRLNDVTGEFKNISLAGAISPHAVSGIDDEVWITDNGSTKGLAIIRIDGTSVESIDLGASKSITPIRLQDGRVGTMDVGDTGVRLTTRSGSGDGDIDVVGRKDVTNAGMVGDVLWYLDGGSSTLGWAFNNRASLATGEYVMPSDSRGLTGLAVTEHRYIWVGERGTGKVLRFDATTPDVDRIGGADRFELAVNIAKNMPASVVRTAFVVSGEKFADALSAAPIAAQLVAPVLLTTSSSLSIATREQLVSMDPDRVVVVGGSASISPETLREITSAVPRAHVNRVDGADRFAISRALLASDLARSNPSTLYVASGLKFPDALSSTAAAVRFLGGILLVNGSIDALSDEEMRVIGAYAGAGKIVKIVGGPASVSIGIEAQIRRVASVQRLGGADRFEVSRAVVLDAFPRVPNKQVFMASGLVFADALAGGALAGVFGAPLLLSQPGCIPNETMGLVRELGTRQLTLLGGLATLNGDVEALKPCA